jgi:hypothetical protein
MIPKTPQYYVSRKESEDQIRNFLIGRPSYSLLQVIGLGGIGKTTLVAKSLLDTKLNDDAIWLNLYEEADITASMRNISDKIDNVQLHRRPIIVLDGAERIGSEKLNVYLNHFKDKYIFPKIIITSREIINRIDGHILAVDSFSKEQASNLLKYWNRSSEETEELYQISQGHPLALSLLNATLNNSSLESIKSNLEFHKVFANNLDDPLMFHIIL